MRRVVGSMVARGFRLVMVVWCVLVGCALFSVVSTQARIVHVPGPSFGQEGAGPGQFKSPLGVAVDDVTHEVYVVDRDNNRVERFGSSSAYETEFNGSGSNAWEAKAALTGRFSRPTEIAVDNSGNPLDPSVGDVYVVDSGHGVIDKFNESGMYVGQLTGTPSGPFPLGVGGIVGVAVDPSGGLWVLQGNNGEIDSFGDALANQYVSKRTTEFGGGTGLAVDGEQDIYLNIGHIVKVSSSGETLVNPFCGEEQTFSFGVAFDSSKKDVYVDNLGSIGECDSSGKTVESFGLGDFNLSNGIAVDAGSGALYVTELEADKVAVFDAIHLPTVSVGPLTVGLLSERKSRSVTLNGVVNPEGLPVTSCVFEYDTRSYVEGEASHGTSVPCSPASLGSGTSPVAVSARLDHLVPEGAYHYRLVAENAAHVASATLDREFYVGPRLGGEFVADVASSSATLQAPVDPEGNDTRYYIQYGITVSYGAYAPAPPPGVDLGSAVVVQNLSVHLQGLQPGTLYHYRFVAVQNGETQGNEMFEEEFGEEDHTFTTQPAVGESVVLPDGRAWELVSPANKKGALIEPVGNGQDQIQAANDGSGIAYLTVGPHVGEDPKGHITWSQVLSQRGPSGWSSQDLTLPMVIPENEQLAGNLTRPSPEYRLFSPDLSLAVVEPQLFGTPLLSAEVKERTLYLLDDRNGSFSPLVTSGNVAPGTKIEEQKGSLSIWEMRFLAATPDLVHVVFKTPLALVAPAIDEEKEQNRRREETHPQWNLYEWNGGKLQLVNILPSGEATHGLASSSLSIVKFAGETEGEAVGAGGVQRAVSNDGRRVAWTWGDPYGSDIGSYMGLFVRDMVEGETVRVGGPAAVFQTMSSDGSRVFYTENGDLYEYDYSTHAQVDLTASHGGGESDAGVQQGVSDVSEDGSYVYFVANGVLAQGALPGACQQTWRPPTLATCNLYVLHYDGSEWKKPKLIAILSQEDEKDWYANAYLGSLDMGGVSSRVSPGGRYLALMSNRSLTGYDNIDVNSPVGEHRRDEEVFLYDAVLGRLVCASCNPTGARPAGVLVTSESLAGRIWPKQWLAGSIPGWDTSQVGSTHQPRYLSDSGRLFFDSPDSLVSQATNGLENVYEYESPGVGDCSSVSVTFSDRSGGCVSLISSGVSSAESVFLDASESGGDAFFLTAARLSVADYDTSLDVYDAHVCTTGAPCLSSPTLPPPCSSGDSCKAAPSPQPEIFGAPPSATFNGPGNITSPGSKGVVGSKSLTRAQKLARALKACHKTRGSQRTACERQARRQYSVKQTRKARPASSGVGR